MLTKICAIILFAAAAARAAFKESSPEIVPIPGGLTGEALTNRYWDCCGGSCNWAQIVHTQNGLPVRSCQKDGVTNSTVDNNANSVCNSDQGTAFTCTNQQPFIVNSTLSYGFAAVSFVGSMDTHHCCECYLLSFHGQLSGKQMLVQAISTGADLLPKQFDIQMPGGGVGRGNIGCEVQWNAPVDGWGDRIGGVRTIEECDQLPDALQEGCRWRFTWMEGVTNPNVTYTQVQCPLELIAISNCGDY